jgi:outer membrane protein
MYRLLFLICLLILSVRVVGAESYHLRLNDAIIQAIDKNNLVRAAGSKADTAHQEISITESRYYPQISFEEALVASNSPTQTFMMKLDEGRFSQNDFQINNLNNPGTYHDYKTALVIQQPIFDPSTAPIKDMAVKEAEKQVLEYDAAKQDTAFQVFRLFLEVQKSNAQFQAFEQAIKDARENLRLTTVRSGAGVGLRSDELRARTHLATVEQQLITTKNNLSLAKMRLANVIGLKEGDTLDIAEPVNSITPVTPPEDMVRVALKNRADLKQSLAEIDRSDAAVRLARSKYIPSIETFASYQMNSKDTPFGSDNDSWTAGVSLKLQLFDGFKRYREKDRATAAKSASGELFENTKRDVRFQVLESFMRREEMGERLAVARHSLQDAEETVRLLGTRFENSLATMVELLDAQTALNQVRSALVESEANYTLAGGNIYYTAGIFIKEMLK